MKDTATGFYRLTPYFRQRPTEYETADIVRHRPTSGSHNVGHGTGSGITFERKQMASDFNGYRHIIDHADIDMTLPTRPTSADTGNADVGHKTGSETGSGNNF